MCCYYRKIFWQCFRNMIKIFGIKYKQLDQIIMVFGKKITMRLSNDPIFLDPKNDIYDLIKLKAIEAGGFSMIASSLDDVRKKASRGVKFYLDKFEQTATIRTEVKKLRNAAFASLDRLYKTNIDKLFLVCKVIDDNSAQYKKYSY